MPSSRLQSRTPSISRGHHPASQASRSSQQTPRAPKVYVVPGHFFEGRPPFRAFELHHGRLAEATLPSQGPVPLDRRFLEVHSKGKKATVVYYCEASMPSLRATDFHPSDFESWIARYGKDDPAYGTAQEIDDNRRAIRSSMYRRFT